MPSSSRRGTPGFWRMSEMEAIEKVQKSEVKTSPPKIKDVYAKLKEIIGEVEEDPHRLIKEMRNARG